VETLAALRTAVPKAIGEVFTATVMVGAQQQDILSKFEGDEGSMAPIVLKKELRGGKADTVNFPMSGLLGAMGRIGDQAYEGYEVNPITGNFQVKLDSHGTATGYTVLNHLMRVDGGSREGHLAKLMKQWWGNKKQNDGLMCYRNEAVDRNTLRPDGKSRDQLSSSDLFSTALADDAKGYAQGLGVKPMETTISDTQAEVQGYLILGPDDCLRSLNADTAYRNAQYYAQERGNKNTLISGHLKKWNGQDFFHWATPHEEHDGSICSPLNPRARIADASVKSNGSGGAGTTHLHLTGTSNITLYGGMRSQAQLGDQATLYAPFEHFSGYDYPFLSYQAAGAGTETGVTDSEARYAWLYDFSNKRIAFVRYVGSGNLGYSLTITDWTSATSAADTATAFRYIGGVNQVGTSTGLDSTNTPGYTFGTEFQFGTTWLIPANKWGTPLGWSLVLGRASLLRCYGAQPMQMLKNERDYGRRRGIAVEGIYGQATAKSIESASTPKGYVLVEHAVDLPGIDLPDCIGLG
jgi:hypothetical protein